MMLTCTGERIGEKGRVVGGEGEYPKSIPSDPGNMRYGILRRQSSAMTQQQQQPFPTVTKTSTCARKVPL